MTLTGHNARTLTKYTESLLEYPRWIIERDVDFTHCQFHGLYTPTVQQCTSCQFGEACSWLNLAPRLVPQDDVLPDLINALTTAAEYMQQAPAADHKSGCHCKTCEWLRTTRQFLHSRHHSA